jgi:NAD(P)-dependent dehydrogenase (short-subunit alcohol dehydrogenase family)
MGVMKKTVLITGRDTPFGAALIAEARARDYSVIATVDRTEADGKSGRKTGQAAPADDGEAEREEGLLVVPWNRASAFSARHVMIECRNLGSKLDAALVVCAPTGAPAPLEKLEPAFVDSFVDAEVKGRVFFAREAAAEFASRGEGLLGMIAYQNGMPLSPLDAMAMGAFHALSQELFAAQVNANYLTQGYSCSLTMDAAFAAFIFKGIEEANHRTSGRWLKFSGREGFLSSLRTIARG